MHSVHKERCCDWDPTRERNSYPPSPRRWTSSTGGRHGASWAHEEVLLSTLSVLLHHQQTNILPPALLRGFINEATKLFPFNALFFDALLRLESLNGVLHRVRGAWERVWEVPESADPFGPGPPPSILLLMVEFEVSRGHLRRGIGILERALQRRETRQSALVWRHYIDLCCLDGRPDAAKRIFYRGINACPWSKSLWEHGVRNQGVLQVMGSQELDDVVKMLNEKELRVRTMVEEVQ